LTKQPKQNPPGWVLLAAIGVGIVLIGSAVLLLLNSNQTSPPQVASAPNNAQNSGQNTADVPFPAIERISATDSHVLVRGGDAVIVDVRDQAAYSEAHAAGAISVPEADLAARIGELPKDQLIITYCT
jgi:hypothetical protein